VSYLVEREEGHHAQRNNTIWSLYMAGATPRKLSDTFDLSVKTINDIIAGRRKSLPQETVDDIRDRSLGFLNSLGSDVMAIFHKPAPPKVDKYGNVVRDPDTGEVARDYSEQLQAALVALRVLERIHRMVGIDAPKVQVHAIASEAAIEQAEKLRNGKFRLLLGGEASA
jgi:hypothetical protein